MFAIPASIATGSIIEITVVILTAAVIAIHTLTEALILTEAITIAIIAITAAVIKIDNFGGSVIKNGWLKFTAIRHKNPD